MQLVQLHDDLFIKKPGGKLYHRDGVWVLLLQIIKHHVNHLRRDEASDLTPTAHFIKHRGCVPADQGKKRLTAAFPHPRGPRRRTELLQASETELATRYLSLLPDRNKC
jgi:hypothetical protein